MNRYSKIRTKRLLDLSRPLYVRRRMTTRGHSFGMGEKLPWQEIGVSQRSIERWFRLRIVSHEPGGDQRPGRNYDQKEIDRREGRTDADGLRLDGPTLEEFTIAGYPPESYPPEGWAARPSAAYDAYLEQLTAPES